MACFMFWFFLSFLFPLFYCRPLTHVDRRDCWHSLSCEGFKRNCSKLVRHQKWRRQTRAIKAHTWLYFLFSFASILHWEARRVVTWRLWFRRTLYTEYTALGFFFSEFLSCCVPMWLWGSSGTSVSNWQMPHFISVPYQSAHPHSHTHTLALHWHAAHSATVHGENQ